MAKKLIDWKSFMRFLKVNKEGVLSGAAVGAAFALYVKAKGINLLAAAYQKGLIDNIMSRSTPVDIAFAKVLITCVAAGALIGLIIDALIKPGK